MIKKLRTFALPKVECMEFCVKKTYSLTQSEREQLNELFRIVFGKPRHIEHMFNQYTENALGYSYHSLFKSEGVIRGAATYVPSYFIYHGKKVLFATGIDVMIAEEHRNFFEFRRIIKNVFKALKADGIPLIYGYPNDNSYPVYKTAGLMRDIGKMHIYCLPYRLGCLKPTLRWLNLVSKMGCNCWVWLCSHFSSKRVAHYVIEKDPATYNETRYHRLDGNYSHTELTDSCTLFYKVILHEGIRTAFIIDLSEKSPRNFALACRFLIKHESSNFDLILYPGYLPFSFHGMFRIPRRFEPKNFYFGAQILNQTEISDDIWDISNWDTNLSMYDLI